MTTAFLAGPPQRHPSPPQANSRRASAVERGGGEGAKHLSVRCRRTLTRDSGRAGTASWSTRRHVGPPGATAAAGLRERGVCASARNRFMLAWFVFSRSRFQHTF